MTIGRTSSNAIKIKTDAGTTRVVECACCKCVTQGDYSSFPNATEAQFEQWKQGSFTLSCFIYVQTQYGSCFADFGSVSVSFNSYDCLWRNIATQTGCESLYAGYSQPSMYDFNIGIARIVDAQGAITYKTVFAGLVRCSVLIDGFFCQPYYFYITSTPEEGAYVAGTFNFFGSTFSIVGQTPGEGENFSVSINIA